ncbi:hypothetical protein RJ640_013206 [Escallonia rubra]|uniref:Uncharacterized protein n=1 Tax=Escallonia rubra TaxID=112253 RepID=A0AA88RYQ3_9ASTE|nr:hypothetical protein RJ640_013206 [Escallonia rubra]
MVVRLRSGTPDLFLVAGPCRKTLMVVRLHLGTLVCSHIAGLYTWNSSQLGSHIVQLVTQRRSRLNVQTQVKSTKASLKAPDTGGVSLITSETTFHEYFIFCMSSHCSNSPGCFDAAISICSSTQMASNELSVNHYIPSLTS